MSNSCTHCPHKGDIKACKAIECHAHESWYALEMIAQNADLLEALEEVMREAIDEHYELCDEDGVLSRARAAIAKAKGESK